MIDKKKVDAFINLVNTPNSCSYHTANKRKFMSVGKKILEEIVELLGLRPHEFTLRTNKAGDGVSGDVILHADYLYVCFDQGGVDECFMYRACDSQKDYTGGANNWMKWADLRDLPKVAKKFKALAPKAQPVETV
jgi:CO/xanthine dehydrogenase Mo-binding subunit